MSSNAALHVALENGFLIEDLSKLVESGELERQGVFCELVVDLQFSPTIDDLADLRHRPALRLSNRTHTFAGDSLPNNVVVFHCRKYTTR
jgi:hypothetical protein